MEVKANIIIPVKNLSKSKNRLSNMLGSYQRQLLVLVMLEDIIRELNNSHFINKIYILTDDELLKREAYYSNVVVVIQKHGLDVNNALKTFLNEALDELSDHPVIIIPSDIPLIKHESVDEIVKMISQLKRSVIISPAHDNGTNLIALPPGKIICFHYGLNSFREHATEVLNAGLSLLIYDSEDLELDLDTPEDVYQLVNSGVNRKTALYLAKML